MDFRRYNPIDIKITWLGIIFQGYADGTFVNASRNAASYSNSIGAQGDVVRVASNDRTGLVTVTLLQSSPTNALLATKHTLDERGVPQIGPLLIKDLNGPTRVTATDAWIEKPADVEYGNSVSNREWVLACANMIIFPGGHTL